MLYSYLIVGLRKQFYGAKNYFTQQIDMINQSHVLTTKCTQTTLADIYRAASGLYTVCLTRHPEGSVGVTCGVVRSTH